MRPALRASLQHAHIVPPCIPRPLPLVPGTQSGWGCSSRHICSANALTKGSALSAAHRWRAAPALQPCPAVSCMHSRQRLRTQQACPRDWFVQEHLLCKCAHKGVPIAAERCCAAPGLQPCPAVSCAGLSVNLSYGSRPLHPVIEFAEQHLPQNCSSGGQLARAGCARLSGRPRRALHPSCAA